MKTIELTFEERQTVLFAMAFVCLRVEEMRNISNPPLNMECFERISECCKAICKKVTDDE